MKCENSVPFFVGINGHTFDGFDREKLWPLLLRTESATPDRPIEKKKKKRGS